MLGYFICFYFTVNPGQIAMWDSGFFIEVYSRLCQALGQCRYDERNKQTRSERSTGAAKTRVREKRREERRGEAVASS